MGTTLALALVVVLLVVALFWGYFRVLLLGVGDPPPGQARFITATAPLPVDEDFGPKDAQRKERYGEPPGMIRAVHRDELGFRGWADMPGDYEGSSASAVSAYIQRSA